MRYSAEDLTTTEADLIRISSNGPQLSSRMLGSVAIWLKLASSVAVDSDDAESYQNRTTKLLWLLLYVVAGAGNIPTASSLLLVCRCCILPSRRTLTALQLDKLIFGLR